MVMPCYNYKTICSWQCKTVYGQAQTSKSTNKAMHKDTEVLKILSQSAPIHLADEKWDSHTVRVSSNQLISTAAKLGLRIK